MHAYVEVHFMKRGMLDAWWLSTTCADLTNSLSSASISSTYPAHWMLHELHKVFHHKAHVRSARRSSSSKGYCTAGPQAQKGAVRRTSTHITPKGIIVHPVL